MSCSGMCVVCSAEWDSGMCVVCSAEWDSGMCVVFSAEWDSDMCVVCSAALAVLYTVQHWLSLFFYLEAKFGPLENWLKKITSMEMVFLRNNSHGPRKEWRDLEELKAEPVDETLSRYNWNWLRHVTRMHSSRMAKITLNTVYTIRQTHAHMWKEFITWYSLPTCFDRRRGHLQGNLQDYREFKQTVKMRKWPTDCYAGYLKLPT